MNKNSPLEIICEKLSFLSSPFPLMSSAPDLFPRMAEFYLLCFQLELRFVIVSNGPGGFHIWAEQMRPNRKLLGMVDFYCLRETFGFEDEAGSFGYCDQPP